MTNYPSASDPVSALTRGNGSTAAHSSDHGRVIGLPENVMHHGATGLGTGDDTAAFTAAETAAGAGGTIYAPLGTYILNNYTPAARIHIKGAGATNGGAGTVLKAKAGASAAVTFSGLRYASMSDLTIDGNSKASTGLVITGDANSSSHGHTYERTNFMNCDVGVHIAQGAISQADNNLFMGCWWADNTTGLWIDSVNGQGQVVLSSSFDTHTTAVRLTHGTLTFNGAGVGTATTAFLIDGGSVEWLHLIDVITEATTTDIHGSGAWPTQGVTLEHTILQGSSYVVNTDADGAVLRTRGCTFHTGAVNFTGNDTMWHGAFDELSLGAAWTASGTNYRRIKTDGDGTHHYFNNVSTPVSHAYISGEFEGNGIATLAKNGVPSDGDFTFPVSGLIAVDTADNRLYVRVGTTWRYVGLT